MGGQDDNIISVEYSLFSIVLILISKSVAVYSLNHFLAITFLAAATIAFASNPYFSNNCIGGPLSPKLSLDRKSVV